MNSFTVEGPEGLNEGQRDKRCSDIAYSRDGGDLSYGLKIFKKGSAITGGGEGRKRGPRREAAFK